MLTQEGWVDLKLLSRQGVSMRAIARLTGLSRATVPRVLPPPVPSRYRSRPPKPKKLDPFVPYLQTILQARPWVRAPLGFLQRKEHSLLLRPPGVGRPHLTIAFKSRLLVIDEVGYFPLTRVEANYCWTGPAMLSMPASGRKIQAVLRALWKGGTEYPRTIGPRSGC